MAQAFGKYRLIRPIAAGGMAEIFLARMDGPGGFSKECAIKRILPQFSRSKEFTNMMLREAKIVAQLNHPNITQVFDFGFIDEHYFLAMEYVDGASLHQVMKRAARGRTALGVRVATTVGIHIAGALAHAHALRTESGENANLVHRDVTPGNILIARRGLAKLADFGIVKVDDAENKTRAGVIKGKFAYMSPEQVSGLTLDGRSDIFSFGIVLYEVALGRRLFRRPQAAAELLAVSQADVPPPTSIEPSFPPDLERVLMKALKRDREERYQSAEEFQYDLEEIVVQHQWTSVGRMLAGVMEQLFPETELEPGLAYESIGDRALATPTGTEQQMYSMAPSMAPRAGVSRAWIAVILATIVSLTVWLWLIILSGD